MASPVGCNRFNRVIRLGRGLGTQAELDTIHGKLERLLARGGARLDAIYFCAHHPDASHPGEDPAYKIACRCRKPDTGMIEQAAAEFHVDRAGSYMIGDTARDFECGRRAGRCTIGVQTGAGWSPTGVLPDFVFPTLTEAVEHVLRRR
jgi:histidinol-phosphate phosphatase family protein